MMNNQIWYASYGSNVLIGRFMCYIGGGKPDISTAYHKILYEFQKGKIRLG